MVPALCLSLDISIRFVKTDTLTHMKAPFMSVKSESLVVSHFLSKPFPKESTKQPPLSPLWTIMHSKHTVTEQMCLL